MTTPPRTSTVAQDSAAQASPAPSDPSSDGDFTTAEISRALGNATAGTAPVGLIGTPAATRAALDHRLWLPDQVGADAVRTITMLATTHRTSAPDVRYQVTDQDVALLRAFETAPTSRPPVLATTAELSPGLADAWLLIAGHWTAVSTGTGDLRFLNAACKLLGTVWAHHRAAADGLRGLGRGARRWNHPGITGRIAAVNAAVARLTADLTFRLGHRLMLDEQPTSATVPAPSPVGPPIDGTYSPRVVLLAGRGSSTARRFLADAAAQRLPVELVCWFTPAVTPSTAESAYDQAWYPPRAYPVDKSAAELFASPAREVETTGWDTVTRLLHDHGPDLVVLAGMPIVPVEVLTQARLGVLNAHNGALPTYRGMDAVGWAVLNNAPIVCSLHLAAAATDAGDVLATTPVSLWPADTLHTRVKTAQHRLLLAGTRYVAHTGRLPTATPQNTALAMHHYRLHPHLKRLLDTSPYASTAAPDQSTQP